MSEGNNEKSGSTIHSEIDAMRVVAEAIENLADPEARMRVLSWLASKFGAPRYEAGKKDLRHGSGEGASLPITEEELPGIARRTANGELEVTVRDLKAKSTIDAAMRLAHIVIYANEKLKGERAVSSRKVLSPILKEWRAYDGNTRLALARHKGIHRDGDQLSLDAIAKKDAEKYIGEILDDSVHGTWNRNGRPGRKAPAKKTPPVEEQGA